MPRGTLKGKLGSHPAHTDRPSGPAGHRPHPVPYDPWSVSEYKSLGKQFSIAALQLPVALFSWFFAHSARRLIIAFPNDKSVPPATVV